MKKRKALWGEKKRKSRKKKIVNYHGQGGMIKHAEVSGQKCYVGPDCSTCKSILKAEGILQKYPLDKAWLDAKFMEKAYSRKIPELLPTGHEKRLKNPLRIPVV